MNFFRDAENKKITFESLTKQYKKYKKKVLDAKVVDKETITKYDETRLEFMRFMEENSAYIKPRKNSYGTFSVEEYIKCKTNENIERSRGFSNNQPIVNSNSLFNDVKTTTPPRINNSNDFLFKKNNSTNQMEYTSRFSSFWDQMPMRNDLGFVYDPKKINNTNSDRIFLNETTFSNNERRPSEVFNTPGEMLKDPPRLDSAQDNSLNFSQQYSVQKNIYDRNFNANQRDSNFIMPNNINKRYSVHNAFERDISRNSLFPPTFTGNNDDISLSPNFFTYSNDPKPSNSAIYNQRRHSVVGFKSPAQVSKNDQIYPTNPDYVSGITRNPQSPPNSRIGQYNTSFHYKNPSEPHKRSLYGEIYPPAPQRPQFVKKEQLFTPPKDDFNDMPPGTIYRPAELYKQQQTHPEQRLSSYSPVNLMQPKGSTSPFPDFDGYNNYRRQEKDFPPQTVARSIPPSSDLMQSKSENFYTKINTAATIAEQAKPKGRRGRKPKNQQILNDHTKDISLKTSTLPINIPNLHSSYVGPNFGPIEAPYTYQDRDIKKIKKNEDAFEPLKKAEIDIQMPEPLSAINPPNVEQVNKSNIFIMEQSNRSSASNVEQVNKSNIFNMEQIRTSPYNSEQINMVNVSTMEQIRTSPHTAEQINMVNVSTMEQIRTSPHTAEQINMANVPILEQIRTSPHTAEQINMAKVPILEQSNEVDINDSANEILKISGNLEKINKETEGFIYNFCDEFIEQVIHTSCAIAHHKNKKNIDEKDVGLALKMEFNIEPPEKSYLPPVKNESDEHIKRMKAIKKDKFN